VAESIIAEAALSPRAGPIGRRGSREASAALAEAETASKALNAMLPGHRAATLAAVAPGQLTAAEALARIDAARRLERIAHHAWRSAAHLLGRGGPALPGETKMECEGGAT
jgi:phosphate:Na+ symporter